MSENQQWNASAYEQQESKLSAQSTAFLNLLTKRGILADTEIRDDKIRQAFTPNGLKGMLLLLAAGAAISGAVLYHLKKGNKDYDERGFRILKDGTYGTASWMSEKEMEEVLEISPIEKAEGTILGEYQGKAVCMPKDTRLNRHFAVFGASGTMKSRAIIRNALFQAIAREESVVITDSKAELYADTAELYRKHGYEVKVFNLVNPSHGDSWNCMSDLSGDTLMAQVLTNVIVGIGLIAWSLMPAPVELVSGQPAGDKPEKTPAEKRM